MQIDGKMQQYENMNLYECDIKSNCIKLDGLLDCIVTNLRDSSGYDMKRCNPEGFSKRMRTSRRVWVLCASPSSIVRGGSNIFTATSTFSFRSKHWYLLGTSDLLLRILERRPDQGNVRVCRSVARSTDIVRYR